MLSAEAAALAAEHYPQALRVTRRRLPWVDDADLESDVGMAVCVLADRWCRGDRCGPFGRWMHATLRYALIDLYRERAGRRPSAVRLISLGAQAGPDHPATWEQVLPDRSTPYLDVDDRLWLAWAADQVAHRAAELLDEREWWVITQRAAGRTLAAIGTELGITESRVCQINAQARNRLRAPAEV